MYGVPGEIGVTSRAAPDPRDIRESFRARVTRLQARIDLTKRLLVESEETIAVLEDVIRTHSERLRELSRETGAAGRIPPGRSRSCMEAWWAD